MTAKGSQCLPVTDKSLILQMVITCVHTHTHTHTLTHTHPAPSAHLVSLKRSMIITFDLYSWKTSTIRLYYDQGYPGTWLLV